MRLQPLAPMTDDAGTGPRWSIATSVLLHGLAVLLVLTWAVGPDLSDGGAPQSFQLVFEGTPSGGKPTPRPMPPAQPAGVTAPPDAPVGTPAPEPLSEPDPAATGNPPPSANAPAPIPEPVPAPTPVPEPAPAEAPAVRLQQPAPIDAPPPVAEPIMPELPPPLPPVPEQPRPAPRPTTPAPRPTPRSPFGSLANPMDLSFAPSAPRPAARGSMASRAIDLSPPAERQGPLRSDPYAEIRAANASADWNRGLLQYWLRHRYYPSQAAANGEEGAVTLQLTVNRSGKVENVEVISRSGSQWLDMAALGTWRNAQLPPFTNEMREDRITFPIPIHYYLIR